MRGIVIQDTLFAERLVPKKDYKLDAINSDNVKNGNGLRVCLFIDEGKKIVGVCIVQCPDELYCINSLKIGKRLYHDIPNGVIGFRLNDFANDQVDDHQKKKRHKNGVHRGKIVVGNQGFLEFIKKEAE